MANLNLLVIEGGVRKQKASNAQTVDFSSIRIGASQLEILEASGHFDLSAKRLTNVANPTGLQDAATKTYVDAFGGLAVQANSGGTTNLLATGPRDILMTGASAETKQLPSTAGLQVGNWWRFANRSSVAVLIQNSAAAAVITVQPQTVAHVRVAATGTETWVAYASPIYSNVDGSLNMASGKIVNLANGTNSGDAVNFSQLANKANVDLSNLSSTAINASLIPASNNAIDVGSASLRFANVFSVALKVGASNLTIAEASGHFDFSAKRLTNILDPVGAQDAATKNYVDIVAQGIKPKQAARVATTANITLDNTTTAVDGVTLADGDRVLVKNQTAPEENGIYVASTSGAWTRATDFDSLSPVDEINGAWVGIQEGTANAGQVFVQYGTVATVGTDPITFTYFSDLSSLTGGDMITVLGGDISVDLSSTGGLESTNPGNAAGQLKIKLDGPSLALSSSGTKVNVDDDTLEVASSVQVKHSREFVNDNAGAITSGQVVYLKSNGAVDLAQANVSGLENVWIGIVKDSSIASTDPGQVNVRPGAIVSGYTGLTPGVKQYVSRDTAGELTESLTGFASGEAVYSVGYAISATELVYQPQFEYLF